MHLDAIPGIMSSLAGSAIGLFVLFVLIDDALGVIGALRAKTFSWDKLPSFLESQFGTKQALAVLGLVVAAAVTGGDAHQALLAAITAGGGAMALSLVNDIAAKLKALVS